MSFPATLYKYRGMNGGAEKYVERTVLHNEIYMALSRTFNDPFDLLPVFSFEGTMEERIEDYIRLHEKFGVQYSGDLRELAKRDVEARLSPETIKQTEAVMSAEHRAAVADVTGVYCVTTKPDNLLMWAHYADNHKGICLEFRGSIALTVGTPMKVQYSDTRTPIEMYRKQPNALELALCTKSSNWEYEDEWRIIRPEYEGGPGIATFSPLELTGIIIGAMADPETVELVKKWAAARTESLTLRQAALNTRKYALDLLPLA